MTEQPPRPRRVRQAIRMAIEDATIREREQGVYVAIEGARFEAGTRDRKAMVLVLASGVRYRLKVRRIGRKDADS